MELFNRSEGWAQLVALFRVMSSLGQERQPDLGGRMSSIDAAIRFRSVGLSCVGEELSGNPQARED